MVSGVWQTREMALTKGYHLSNETTGFQQRFVCAESFTGLVIIIIYLTQALGP